MFAKVFAQIFDSSIAENHEVRHIFEDLLKLADKDGVVDMTVEAIARRTNVPLEKVRHGIVALLKPDPESRSKEQEGRRLVPLDSHRDWGWVIVNYHHYRSIVDEEGRRKYFRDAKQRQRQRKGEKWAGRGRNVDAAVRAYEKSVENDEPREVQDAIVTRSLPEKLQGTIHEIQNLGSDGGRSNGKKLEDDLHPEGNERAVDAKLGQEALCDAGGAERVQGAGVSAAGAGQLAMGMREEPGHFENGVWVKD